MLSAQHMVHTDLISSKHDPHWCYQLKTWFTLILSAQNMVHTDVISSAHGPHWCYQLKTWYTLMLSAQHIAHTDVISSTHGPHWCYHDQQCCCNSIYGFLLLHCQKVCKVKLPFFSHLRYLFQKLRVSTAEWYWIDLFSHGAVNGHYCLLVPWRLTFRSHICVYSVFISYKTNMWNFLNKIVYEIKGNLPCCPVS